MRRAADVVAEAHTVCFTLGRKAFTELLGPIEDVWRFEALRKVPVLFALQERQLFDLARCMKTHAIAADQMVFRQGDPGAALSAHFLSSPLASRGSPETLPLGTCPSCELFCWRHVEGTTMLFCPGLSSVHEAAWHIAPCSPVKQAVSNAACM